MEKHGFYLMDNKEESVRLEVKTDPEAVREEARWCGVKPGMRVMDAGCGPGLTSALLLELLQPGGEMLGVDYMEPRIRDAREKYGERPGMAFLLHDLRQPLPPMEPFDLIWVRFVLEYNLRESLDIVRNLTACLKPEGRLCLMDLDHNCLSHYPLTESMETTLQEGMKRFQRDLNFDPYAGRKHDYPGGYRGFFSDFDAFFNDPRRFTYTPMILCKGRKPSAGSGSTGE